MHIDDQVRVSRPESPTEPVTTKLNVFTTNIGTSGEFILPTVTNDSDRCVTCLLWDITNPGENLKCDDCREKAFSQHEALPAQDGSALAKLTIPRLEIPKEQPSTTNKLRKDSVTRCSACEISSMIGPSMSPKCPSCSPDPNLLSPISPSQPSQVRRSCAKRPSKLPPHALFCLKQWLRENRSNPYPDAETKDSLARECGITEKQVNTWFTNARARRLNNNSPDRSTPQSEDEGHYESGFSSVASTPICTSGVPFSHGTPVDRRASDTPNFANNGYNQITPASNRRGKKKDYSGMNDMSPVNNQISPILTTPTATTPGKFGEHETWQCTFCLQPIAPKSWRRHEETQHRPKRKWTCLLNGPEISLPARSPTSTFCAFCMVKNPTREHFLQSHRIAECMNKHEDERTFLRPDHLRQHVKNFHKSTLWEVIRDVWRREGPGEADEVETWQCGFCEMDLKGWDKRETHISGHFKAGKTMQDWRFQPTNLPAALPPMLDDTPMKPKRRNSAEHSNMFTKLARRFSGDRTTRHQHFDAQPPSQLLLQTPPHAQLAPQFHQHQHQHHMSLGPAFPGLPSSSSAVLPSTPLLPDLVFDTFMQEICGNRFDSCEPLAPGAELYMPSASASTAVTAGGVGAVPSSAYMPQDTVVRDDGVELDLDDFLNVGVEAEFDGGWGQ